MHEAKSALLPTLDALDEKLDAISSIELPSVSQEAELFDSRSSGPLDRRKEIAELVDVHRDNLSGLLELPSLVNSCIKAGRIDEALQLTAHLNSIAAPFGKEDGAPAHSDGLSLLHALIEEVQGLLVDLQSALIKAWSVQGLRLPAAKRALSHLRALAQASSIFPDGKSSGLSEAQLCLVFLRTRISLVHERLRTIKQTSEVETGRLAASQDDNTRLIHVVFDMLRRYVDAWREGALDTLGMASALFPPEAETPAGGGMTPRSLIVAASEQFTSDLASILRDSVHVVKQTLRDPQRRQDVAERLAALHRQLRYAAVACSRLGLNFAPILRSSAARGSFPESIALEVFAAGCQEAVQNAKKALQGGISRLLEDADLAALMRNEDLGLQEDNDAPPSSIGRVPPVARFVNDVVEAVNTLRIFAPLFIKRDVVNAAQSALADFSILLHDAARDTDPRSPSGLSRDRLMALMPALEHIEPEEVDARAKDACKLVIGQTIKIWSDSAVPWILSSISKGVYGGSRAPKLGTDLSVQVERGQELWKEAERCWEDGEQRRRSADERRREEAAEAAKVEEVRKERERAELERKQEEARRQKEEEEHKQLAEEAERKRIEEEKRRQRAEAERKRKEEEESRLRKAEEERVKREEEERVKQGEQKRLKQEEEERIKRKEEDRVKREEEQRVKQEEEERLRREEEERVKREEEERVKREEEEQRNKRKEQERLKREEEKRVKQEEEERQKRQEEERLRREAEEQTKKIEEERLRKEAEEAEKRQQEEKDLEAAEQARKEEEAKAAAEQAKKEEEEEAERANKEEEERAQKAEAARLLKEKEDQSKEAADEAGEPSKNDQADQDGGERAEEESNKLDPVKTAEDDPPSTEVSDAALPAHTETAYIDKTTTETPDGKEAEPAASTVAPQASEIASAASAEAAQEEKPASSKPEGKKKMTLAEKLKLKQEQRDREKREAEAEGKA